MADKSYRLDKQITIMMCNSGAQEFDLKMSCFWRATDDFFCKHQCSLFWSHWKKLIWNKNYSILSAIANAIVSKLEISTAALCEVEPSIPKSNQLDFSPDNSDNFLPVPPFVRLSPHYFRFTGFEKEKRMRKTIFLFIFSVSFFRFIFSVSFFIAP